VGINLRRLRLARGLSLVELGRLSGLAKGTLTQLEAGRANPTIETLHALAGALGAGLPDLVADPPAVETEVVRAHEGLVTSGRIMSGRLVNRSDLGTMVAELFDMALSAGETHHAQPHAGGVVEQIFVLGGTLQVGPEGHEVVLDRGDHARFAADRPHVYRALDGEARYLVWQLQPTLPAPAATLPADDDALASVERLVPRAPGVPPPEPAPARTLPQPPVRGRRPATRTTPGPRGDRPRPPGPGR
jgi:transcriptional regulator with XRE-family HTH domain